MSHLRKCFVRHNGLWDSTAARLHSSPFQVEKDNEEKNRIRCRLLSRVRNDVSNTQKKRYNEISKKKEKNLRNGDHVLDTIFPQFFSSLQTAQVGQRERLRLQ